MNTFELARELEAKFKEVNFFVSRGNFSNLIGTNPNAECLDKIPGEYLSLIDDIKKLISSIEFAVETARKNHILGDAQY